LEGSAGVDHPLLQAALLAFAAPVMEEFVFRRCIIRRLLPCGEKAALFTSALLFALFHSAVNQVCYAFLLGLVFGYVYLKTGRLRYSIGLHVIINSMTAAVLPVLLTLAAGSTSGVNPNEVELMSVILEPSVLALLAYLAAVLVLSQLGGVLFFFGVRERELAGNTVSRRTVLFSWGMIVFLAIAVLGLW
jgi:membrane protease YdiL (CAAX protease family)